MINRNGEFRMNNYLNAILFGLVGLMGIAVMLGWIFEIPILVQVMIGLAPMQFNNALCFSVIGLAGISYIIRWRWLLLVSGSFGALLSSITLLQYFVKADFGIDFLFMNTHELIPTAHPGSMAPNSAAGHLISFVSLLLLMDNRLLFTRVASWLGATVAALGFVSFAGYLIDMDGGFNWGRYTQMSLHTSIGFILAGSALGVTIIPKRRRIEKSKFLLWPFEIILLAMVFLIDLQIPQGVAVGLLYVMPLLAAWYFKDRRYILLVAVICNLLIVFDIMLATEYVAGKEAVMFNRIMSIVAVWIAAAIFYFLKKLSENQNETELKFKLAVEGTTAGIWDWKNVNQDEEWWSPQFYKLLGYSINEIPASLETFSNLVHPDDRKYTFKMVKRHFEKRVPFLVEYRLKHKSGKYKWFQGSGQATWDDDGKPMRMVGTIIDINSRKLSEEAELKRAAELAEKNRELEEFTYVASHDLQEPVRTIASFADLFEQSYADKLDEEGRQYLQFIKGASMRSQQLIVDLLDYSRLGKSREMIQVNMNETIQDALVDLSVKIKEAKATIKVDDLPTITGNATELRLLCQNLISNAIKFRKAEINPEIKISVQQNETGYQFSVSDNGIGIEEKYLDRIFVIFKRLHGKTEYEGTGIGLAHCKKIVELHHGRIWVESKVGVGSTFLFVIPSEIES